MCELGSEASKKKVPLVSRAKVRVTVKVSIQILSRSEVFYSTDFEGFVKGNRS